MATARRSQGPVHGEMLAEGGRLTEEMVGLTDRAIELHATCHEAIHSIVPRQQDEWERPPEARPC